MTRRTARADRRALLILVAAMVLAFPASTAAFPPPPDQSTNVPVNDNPAFLQVFTNNVENLMDGDSPGTEANGCKGEWTDLEYYMRSYGTAPDLFLVQQVNPANLVDLLAKMNQVLLPEGNDHYASLIATNTPDDTNEENCPDKSEQSNGIIYRTGRLAPIGTPSTWQPKRQNSSGACVLNSASRTLSIAAKFTDLATPGGARTVVAASIHWPIQDNGGLPCARDNGIDLAGKLSVLGGSVRIWGGDANVDDLDGSNAWRSWYSKMNGDLGGSLNYRDVIYDDCDETTGSTSALKDCSRDSWTASGPGKRFDFIFARMGTGQMPFVGDEHTVTFNEADGAGQLYTGHNGFGLHYSLHRAVHARVHYCTTQFCS